MRLLARLLALVLLALVPLAPTMSQERTFSHTGVAKDADRYETYLKANWKPGKLDSARLRAAAENALGPDPRAAARNFAMAVVAGRSLTRTFTLSLALWGAPIAVMGIVPNPFVAFAMAGIIGAVIFVLCLVMLVRFITS